MDGSPRVRWRAIPLDDGVAWDAALAGMAHAPAHTHALRQVLHRPDDGPEWLFLCETDASRFVLPIAERAGDGPRDLVTPLGFAGVVGRGDPGVFWTAWRAWAAKRGALASYVALHPMLSPEGIVAGATRNPRDLFVLPLDGARETLGARLSRHARRQLRGFDPGTVVRDTPELVERFVASYPDFMRSRGAGGVTAHGPDTLRALCTLPGAMLLGIRSDDGHRFASFALFLRTTHGAEWLYGIRSDPDASILPLIRAASVALAEEGVPWLHLGGGVTPGDGIEEFKRRMGAERRPAYELRQVFDPGAYAGACRAAGVDPGDTGYFPAWRRPAAA